MVRRYLTLAKQVFILFWVGMFLFIAFSVILNTGEVNLQTERQLQRTMKELDTLHHQNRELSSVVNMLREVYLNTSKEALQVVAAPLNGKSPETREVLVRPSQHSSPSLEQELARRKVDTNVKEFWYYMRSELNKLRKVAENISSLKEEIDVILNTGANYQRTLQNDLHTLGEEVDSLEEWRFSQSQSLGSLVQRRFKHLQNPGDCNTARKVVCKLNKSCGYGCVLHHVTYCLIMAYATERTMILQSKGWKYASKGWETLFLPLSERCTDDKGESRQIWSTDSINANYQVLDLPIIDSLQNRPAALPLAVPEDLADNITRFHGNPAVWWIGQFVTYVTRPQPEFKTYLEQTKYTLNFSHPIVGLHVRRTDKITAREAGYHSLAEYMTYVEEWFDTYEQKHPGADRKVYLATDDTTVLKEAQTLFPNYTFLNDVNISISAGLNTRYSEESVRGVVTDIHILSLCDFLVCTFSSQVCRAAYELMQPMRGDASGWFKSLDDIYYYGGQHAHEVVAVEPHKRTPKSQEIELRVGDIIHMAGNHWDGYSKGANRMTGQTGLFPSYKVRDKVVKVKMPTYPLVKPTR